MPVDNITIETSTKCQASCIVCPNHYNPRKPHFMPLEEFEAILRFFPLKKVVLCGMYEPLLDPRLEEIFEIIREVHDEAEVTIFTNGELLSNGKADILLKNDCFKNLVISIHGYSESVYENVMQGLHRNRVYDNVLNFIKARQADTPKVSVSFVRIKQNIHELDAFRQFWTGKVDTVSDYEIMNWNGQIPIEQFLIEEPKHVRICPMFPKPLVIDAHGNIVKCCYDFKWNYGHVLKGGLERWLSKKPISETYPLDDCKKCYGWKYY